MVYLANDTLWKDTVKIKSLPKAEFLEKSKLFLQKTHEGVKKVSKQDGISLTFNRPIAQVNNENLGLYADTTQTLVSGQLKVDSTGFGVAIEHDWKYGTPYELLLLPGAMTDIYGLQNDTISLSYAIFAAEDLGEMIGEIVSLDSTQAYIISLMTKSKKEIKRYTSQGQSSFSFSEQNMEPGEYMIEITLDANKNGRWDKGDFDLKTYPERQYSQNLETLRANWTVEVSITPQFGKKEK